MLLRLKLKCKVWRKTIRIPFDCFVKPLRGSPINFCQVSIQNNSLTTNDPNEVLDGLPGNNGGLGFHVVVTGLGNANRCWKGG